MSTKRSLRSQAPVALMLATLAGGSHAETRYLDCVLHNEESKNNTLHIIIDDDSDKAEVVQHLGTSECIKDRSCPTQLFNKEVLPTFIRLSKSSITSFSSYVHTIEIDRTNLQTVVHLNIDIDESSSNPKMKSHNTWVGHCDLQANPAKKLL
ncbi:hypothetical protein AN401_07160 [Zobellella denitrificans]|uniref:Uncharacterized protein n=1 Tax=Zobellella denitrificans TaxID=347534 RepID=A0A291HNG8_9GAMM|nr:hypothetical protein [Zobellella denitrificans]ATG73662.1 hypothetical protein AN401_07160 [Zobellella denitrificans]